MPEEPPDYAACLAHPEVSVPERALAPVFVHPEVSVPERGGLVQRVFEGWAFAEVFADSAVRMKKDCVRAVPELLSALAPFVFLIFSFRKLPLF